jgi:hypothetical protein
VKLALLALGLTLAACTGETPAQKAAADLTKAETAMTECKKRVGLGDVPTPDTSVMDDPAARGAALTPEMAGQLRLKVQCRAELDALLAARKSARP